MQILLWTLDHYHYRLDSEFFVLLSAITGIYWKVQFFKCMAEFTKGLIRNNQKTSSAILPLPVSVQPLATLKLSSPLLPLIPTPARKQSNNQEIYININTLCNRFACSQASNQQNIMRADSVWTTLLRDERVMAHGLTDNKTRRSRATADERQWCVQVARRFLLWMHTHMAH